MSHKILIREIFHCFQPFGPLLEEKFYTFCTKNVRPESDENVSQHFVEKVHLSIQLWWKLVFYVWHSHKKRWEGKKILWNEASNDKISAKFNAIKSKCRYFHSSVVLIARNCRRNDSKKLFFTQSSGNDTFLKGIRHFIWHFCIIIAIPLQWEHDEEMQWAEP